MELLPRIAVLDDSILTNMWKTYFNDLYYKSNFFRSRQMGLSYTIHRDTDMNVAHYSKFLIRLNSLQARLCPVLILQKHFRRYAQEKRYDFLRKHFTDAVYALQSYVIRRRQSEVLKTKIRFIYRSCLSRIATI